MKKVAEALTEKIRRTDAVIRYGGDEFLIVFTCCSEDIIKKKIEEFREEINHIAANEHKLFNGAEFGYSYRKAFRKDQKLLRAMINEADVKLYYDKKNSE
ncbi:MAG: diguanylate cyclase [Lachnospiraceae bacterium]|nr:diguanylate cyclase [Lachnospiraceae bacterium]